MMDINHTLKTAWIRQLKEDWKTANYNFFKNCMHPPNIELSNSEEVVGRWKGAPFRHLSISTVLINTHAWEDVQEVLYHEMVHQYVEEVLIIREEMPHGKIFKSICREKCIDPAATGTIHAWAEKRRNRSSICSENHKVLGKIHKLLSLAQSANEHEAHLAMAKAHELLLRHNLSLLEAQTKWNYIHKQIGEVGRRNPINSIISSILGKFFFVEAIWAFGYDQHKNQSGRILEIYGTPENVEMAEYVYHYLRNISELLWDEYKTQKKMKGNRHRRTFIYGLLEGFYHKLDTRVMENQSKKLVWKGDPRLKEYFHQRNPRLIRSSSRFSKSCQDTYHSGIAQGKKLIIHKGMHGKGNRKGEMKFLN